jgi:hypothetical protein
VRQAGALGVEMVHGAEVVGFPYDMEGDIRGVRFVPAGGGAAAELRADVVVLANGTGVEALAARAGVSVPLVSRPGVLARSAPVPGAARLRKIVVSPDLHILQRGDGCLSVGESKETGGASSAADAVTASAVGGGGGQPAPGSGAPSHGSEDGARMMRALRGLFGNAFAALPAEAVTLGWRPMPADGLPIVGFANGCCATRPPSLYVVVTHSGITLGASSLV